MYSIMPEDKMLRLEPRPEVEMLHSITLPLEVFLELHEKAVKYDILKRDCTYPTGLEKAVFGVDEQKGKEQSSSETKDV